jgi:Cu+-exporting ATPase
MTTHDSCCHTGPAAPPNQAPNPAAKPGMYTCPMHPEVLREGPGSCPKCGMALEPVSGGADPDETELRDMTKRLIVAAVLTAPLFLVSMGAHLPNNPFANLGAARPFLEMALATPVCLWAAWPFHQRAVASIGHRSLNMFTLIGLGVSVAFLFSVVAAVVP